jgi:synaptobrevin family protein YKT6
MHSQGVSGVIISDKEYPSRVAFSLLNKIMDETLTKYPQWKTAETIEYSELAQYIQKYQDPQQADNIMKVQKELDETTAILVRKERMKCKADS